MLPTPIQYLRTLRILHLALSGSVIMFGTITVLLKSQGLADPVLAGQERLLLPIAAGIAMAGIAASALLFRSRLEAVRSMATLDRKLYAYRTAQLVRWALAEGPALLNVIFAFLTKSPLFLVFAGAALVYLLGSRPPASVDQACDTMNVSPEDRQHWEEQS